jgi:hypothetical protein
LFWYGIYEESDEESDEKSVVSKKKNDEGV